MSINVVPESERTLAEFVDQRFRGPGVRLQILGALTFGLVIGLSRGWIVFAVCLAVGLGGGFIFGYVRFRRTGRI